MPRPTSAAPALLVALAILATLAAVGLALRPAPVQALAFTVTKTADTNDGSCDTADCSLREAIIAANDSAGADTITVPSGTYTLTLTGDSEENAATGDLDITDDVTITGIAARQTIIDGNATDRVFDVKADVVAEINTVTIQGGKALNGGGIRNNGTLTLNDVTVTANTAGDSSTSNGGGVLNVGTFTAVASRISGNDTTGSGAGIDNVGSATLTGTAVIGNIAALNGGGLNNSSGTLTIEGGSRIETNTANSAATGGGGILAGNGTATITDSTLRGNTAVTSGGAINVASNAIVSLTDSTVSANSASDGGAIDVGGVVTITTSTLDGNQASDDGGALFLGSNGVLTALNSTFSGNSAADEGGALFAGAGGTATLTHATIANNSAAAGGGIREANGTVEVRNTIVALSTSGGDCSGTVNTVGVNLDSDGTCAFALSSAAPGLDTLQDNGGPTFTHALQAGSPAINAALASACLVRDQRGVLRPAAFCDIGAFERSLIDLIGEIIWVPVTDDFAWFLRLTASNDGDDGAANVTGTVTLPPEVRFSSAPAECVLTSDETTGAETVACDFGDLAAGASAAVDIRVTTVQSGAAVAGATLTGIGEEQNLADNAAQATAQVQAATTTSVTLAAAEWNLVGWHGPPTPVAEAIAGIAAQIDALFVFDTVTQGFLSFRPAAPPSLNSLITLETGQGIWLRRLDPRGTSIVWEQPAGALLPAVQLRAGANLVLWRGADGLAIADAVAALTDAELARLFLWDAAAQRFLSFDPTLPPSLAGLNTAATLPFGAGVWMIMRQDALWSFAAGGTFD